MKKYLVDIVKNYKLHVVFIGALVIRLWGSNYGFPHILNIDETSFVRSVTGLRFSLNPGRFDWPNGYFYFHFVFYSIFYYFRVFLQLIGLKSYLESFFPLLWQDPIVFYWLSRVVNAFMGALTVYPLFYATKKLLKSSLLALLSAITITFIPYHVADSHLALIDTGLTFWCATLAYFIFSIIEKPSYRNFVLTGILLGIAFGTKYNAIFYIIPIFIAIIYSIRASKLTTRVKTLYSTNYIKKYLALGISFLFSFLLTNPFVIFDYDLFWSDKYGRGFLFQFKNVGSKELFELPGEFIKLFYTQSVVDFGLGLYLIIFCGFVLYLFFNFRNKVTNLTLLLPVLLFTYMTSKDRNPSHYFQFLYPLLAVYFVYFINLVSFIIAKLFKLKANYVLFTLFLLVISFSVKDSLILAYKYGNVDTRQLATNYLNSTFPKGTFIYYYGNDLDLVSFTDISEEKIKRIDISNVDTSKLPFILVLGVRGLTYADVMEGKRDTRKIEGNESRFLNNSELLYYTVPTPYQFGPSIFIFKINEIKN